VIALDLSRLLSRAGRGTPTGIDRVELAYAEHLATGSATCFAAFGGGGIGLVPGRTARRFVGTIAAAWRGTGEQAQADRQARLLALQARALLFAGGERALA